MLYSFYLDPQYRKSQSEIVKKCWQNGIYRPRVKPLKLCHCKNPDCKKTFRTKPADPKIFCSRNCAAHLNNTGRLLSPLTKLKISKAISSMPKHFWECKTKPKITLICSGCTKSFKVTPYLAKKRKYCSSNCAITTIGKQTTSPKASKGKPGIRPDINPKTCFYSTWEANIARTFNLIGIKWQYAPRIFNLGKHTYRPDFYLPDFNTYVEVKNFMGNYSLERDRQFRKLYPNIKLDLILKKEYLEIKSNYKYFIKNWEY